MTETLEDFIPDLKLEKNQSIAISITNLDDNKNQSFNANEVFYPASLIKLFSAFWCFDKLKEPDFHYRYEDELLRAIEASLKDSDNDASSYLYDFLTGNFIGSDLVEKRRSYSQFFIDKGFSSQLKLHNKCFSFGPYGEDQRLFQVEGSNQILISDIDLIMKMIIDTRPELLEFMARDGSDEQSDFIFSAIDVEDLDFFYSKAGWTSTVRHDTAYFSYKKKKYLLTILTKGLSDDKELVSEIATAFFR